MEASTGIEPVYTDLQSNPVSFQSKGLDEKTYQDIQRTSDEHDTPVFSGRNPAFTLRAEHLTTLCLAIANCDPRDACQIMSAALFDLTNGAPTPALIGIMDEAGFWADWATRDQLKAYCLACFTRMSEADQLAFLCYVRRAP